MHHGKLLSTHSTSVPHDASHNDTSVDASFMSNFDTTGLLNDIFGVHNEGNIENSVANNIWDMERD